MCTEALGYLGSLREAPHFILMRPWGTKATVSALSLSEAGEQNRALSLKLLTLNFCGDSLPLWTGSVSTSVLLRDSLVLLGFWLRLRFLCSVIWASQV